MSMRLTALQPPETCKVSAIFMAHGRWDINDVIISSLSSPGLTQTWKKIGKILP